MLGETVFMKLEIIKTPNTKLMIAVKLSRKIARAMVDLIQKTNVREHASMMEREKPVLTHASRHSLRFQFNSKHVLNDAIRQMLVHLNLLIAQVEEDITKKIIASRHA